MYCEIGEGCGECKVCLGVEKGHLHHGMFLSPESGVIGVEEVRRFLALARRRVPKGTGRRLAVVYEPEKATQQAQNGLLKALEEGYRGVIFILVCQVSEGVLPTIRSRALPIYIGSPYWEGEEPILESLVETFVKWWGVGEYRMLLGLSDQALSKSLDPIQVAQAFMRLLCDWIQYRETGESRNIKGEINKRISEALIYSVYFDMGEVVTAARLHRVGTKMMFDRVFLSKVGVWRGRQ